MLLVHLLLCINQGHFNSSTTKQKNGGGLYLEMNAKLYVLKPQRSQSNNENLLSFTDNHANYGRAIYVADDTNSGACSPDNECFFQTLALHRRFVAN